MPVWWVALKCSIGLVTAGGGMFYLNYAFSRSGKKNGTAYLCLGMSALVAGLVISAPIILDASPL